MQPKAFLPSNQDVLVQALLGGVAGVMQLQLYRSLRRGCGGVGGVPPPQTHPQALTMTYRDGVGCQAVVSMLARWCWQVGLGTALQMQTWQRHNRSSTWLFSDVSTLPDSL